MHEEDMFEEDTLNEDQNPTNIVEDRFLFLTNRTNLLAIMSSGLIGPSNIFEKYRDDLLTVTKGLVPLLAKGASEDLVALTTTNTETNFPVILEIDRFKLAPDSFAYGITAEGDIKEKPGIDENFIVRLCDTVLSTDMIKEVHFSSEDDLEDFVARMFENVPIDLFSLTVSKKLFNLDSPFPVKYFDNITESNVQDIQKSARLSNRVAASIALLSESMEKESDVLLLSSLLTYPYDGDRHKNISAEYNKLSKVVNSMVSQDDSESDSDSDSDYRLLETVLNVLVDLNPKEGWVALDFIEKIYSSYQSTATEIDEKTAEWFEICKKILKNEMDIPEDRNMFADEQNIIKRAVLFFILRPEYDDIFDRENSFLNPGHFVKTIAVFLAGFRIGYASLSTQFKHIHHQIFAPLRAYIINYSLGKGDVNIELLNDIRIEMEPGPDSCHYRLFRGVIELGEIDIRNKVHNIIQKMQDKGHIGGEYDLYRGQYTYTFEYEDSNRKQPIKLDFDRINNTLIISSACFEITKISHTKKITKNTLEAILSKNYEGLGSWSYEKGVAITLNRYIPHEDINRHDIIDIIEFIAKTADEVEEEIFKQDRVK